MKLHFDPSLPHQTAAIEAVCDLFRGQEIGRDAFGIGVRGDPATDQETLDGVLSASLGGVGNRLSLDDETLLQNLQAVQRRQGLPLSASMGLQASPDFTVEMETGTGKTYVYLRTMFELQRRYGWRKFVIVVPSVAIREGVHQTLLTTREHFGALYPASRGHAFFTYDANRLGALRQFATSAQLQVMVISVGAINKFGDAEAAEAEEQDENRRRERSRNVMYRPSERTGGERPIDLVRATRPIVIVDEPQSVDGGIDGRGRQALARMAPLCTLRYSATHVDTHHPVYRLDAVQASEQGLVKRIEVASATVDQAHNRAHVRLLRISRRSGQIVASVELDVENDAGHVHRQTVVVQDGDDLATLTRRPLYAGLRVGELRMSTGAGTGAGTATDALMELHLSGGTTHLREGETHGDIDPLVLARLMIRRTIREHLIKQRRLRPRGIKVLSLFFIDAVARYRLHDEQGRPLPGPYAEIFEDEYRRWSVHPDFHDLFDAADVLDAASDAGAAAPGGPPMRAASEVHAGYFSVDRRRIGNRMVEVARDTSGSSAADDDTYALIMRDKERLLGFDSPLQFIFSHSALKEGWDNPNVFQICHFSSRQTERWRRQTLGRGLRLCVDQQGRRVMGAEVNTLTVIAHESYREFAQALQRDYQADGLAFDASRSRMPPLADAEQRSPVRVRRAVLDSPEFKALWDRIKHKTTYRVAFDPQRLIAACTAAVRQTPPIGRARLQWRKAALAIGEAGVVVDEQAGADQQALDESDLALPDLLGELQQRTQLRRASLVRILADSGRLDDFVRNPQRFIESVADAINHCKRLTLVDGIRYQRLGEDMYYAQELFERHELIAHLDSLVRDTRRSVHEHVPCDSAVERDFAAQLEKNDAIKVYAKLPRWFQVPTPLGGYNPDWAVLVATPAGERLYFVAETKSSLHSLDLRADELARSEYGRRHFEALAEALAPSLPAGERPVLYDRFIDVAGLVERAQSLG